MVRRFSFIVLDYDYRRIFLHTFQKEEIAFSFLMAMFKCRKIKQRILFSDVIEPPPLAEVEIQ